MGRHHLRRRGPIYRARNAWLTHQARPKTIKPPKFKTGSRDGLVVGIAMFGTLGVGGLVAVLTPGGARLAPVLAEPVHVPAPEAPAVVFAEPFVPPAEYEFPVTVDPAPVPPRVQWVVEREELPEPEPKLLGGDRSTRTMKKMDRARDRDYDRRDTRRASSNDRDRDGQRGQGEHRWGGWNREGRDDGDRGGREGRDGGSKGGERGSEGGERGSEGGEHGHDGGSRGERGGHGKGGRR